MSNISIMSFKSHVTSTKLAEQKALRYKKNNIEGLNQVSVSTKCENKNSNNLSSKMNAKDYKNVYLVQKRNIK